MIQKKLPISGSFIHSLLILVLFTAFCLNVTSVPFCHPICHDYINTCFDTTENGCYVCAINIYKDKDFTNPFNPCVLKDQRRIEFRELNSNSMSLAGYSTSRGIPKSCSTYTFSGEYVNSDYLSKNFTGITNEHYELIIRFNVGYMGSWGEDDKLQLQIHDGVSTTYKHWRYNCGMMITPNGTDDDTVNLCSGAGTDCIKIKEFTIQHNSSYVFLKWTALTSQSDPTVQNWGIKDLMIVSKTCHRYCDKCYGGNVNECLTCSAGYFLRGNTCIQKCPKLAIPETQECVDSCPTGYYHNMLNNFCEKCLDGCTLCSSSSHCLLWQYDSPKDNLFTEKLQLWVVMIIGGVVLLGLVLWKLVLKKYFHTQLSEQSNSNDQKKSQKNSNDSADYNELRNTQENITNHLWIQSMDNIDPIKVDVRKRKKRKADLPPLMDEGKSQTKL